jgi:NitT/TauT family transport system ATP-binding protein
MDQDDLSDEASKDLGGITLRGVSKTYQVRRRPVVALDSADLTSAPGEFLALLGPSGCGKSTILRILAGLIRPTRGAALSHGQPLVGLNTGAAMVFQSFALYPWMTVVENVEVVLAAAGKTRTEASERARQSVRLVGLSGFEAEYPRALSGGMKQRVGIARALSVDPEVLMMDEPFSQVDALTAESLRAEVLDIWQARDRHLSTILLVSHDIKEVAYMADRIVVLGANPGRVRTVVENRLPRPRDYRSPEILNLVDQLHDIITKAELPDVPPPATTGMQAFEPLPDVLPGEVVGLLEYLDARGGREEIFRIAADTRREFGRIITVVRAAEMLDLVDTPKRMVVLEPEGKLFVKSAPDQRSTIWRQHLLKLRLFRDLHDLLRRQPEHEVDRDFLLETLILNMPQEDYQKMFNTFLNWARYGDLFAYDEATEKITLRDGQG